VEVGKLAQVFLGREGRLDGAAVQDFVLVEDPTPLMLELDTELAGGAMRGADFAKASTRSRKRRPHLRAS
jgi:hypothetical protein